jgi:hypothetical protein
LKGKSPWNKLEALSIKSAEEGAIQVLMKKKSQVLLSQEALQVPITLESVNRKPAWASKCLQASV